MSYLEKLHLKLPEEWHIIFHSIQDATDYKTHYYFIYYQEKKHQKINGIPSLIVRYNPILRIIKM